MPQNRNKLIELFIGNISNAVVHEILTKAIDDENIRRHYDKELKVSFDTAKKYREKINPVNTTLPEKDTDYIREKIKKNASNSPTHPQQAVGYNLNKFRCTQNALHFASL
ncbi:hypothetical protein J4434_07240 [Candidatus Woesearchaeota archaeon]|nr:hypothetical protein [Candidatus Woesearchaeota archaeon]